MRGIGAQNLVIYVVGFLADEKGKLTVCELKCKPPTIFSGIHLEEANDNWRLHYKIYYNIKELNVRKCQ